MSKFDKAMENLFGRLDTLEQKLNEKPPKVKKEKQTGELKLLQEHYDGKFASLKEELDAIKETIQPARSGMESGKSWIDILFKWPEFDGDSDDTQT